MALALPIPYELLNDAPEEDTGIKKWLWTIEAYHRAVDLGFLKEDDRIELLRGELYEKLPQNPPHYYALLVIAKSLDRSFGSRFNTRIQGPITLPDHSEPEPDVVVVRGSISKFAEQHPGPTDIALIVEISDTTLRTDVGLKASIYSEAGISEYSVVNIPQRRIESYREPTSDEDGNWIYRLISVYRERETIQPLASAKPVRIAKLFPAKEGARKLV